MNDTLRSALNDGLAGLTLKIKEPPNEVVLQKVRTYTHKTLSKQISEVGLVHSIV